MKLNKKGFGVAEIAIVILLIGILAAAVIAGFMGIKQNAHDAVDSQQKFAETMDHELKHTFPTILSTNQNGLHIKSGEYEVYDVSKYTVYGQKGDDGFNYGLRNDGTLYLYGHGYETNAIVGDYTPAGGTVIWDAAIGNNGNLYIEGVRIVGGGNRGQNSNFTTGYNNATKNNYAMFCWAGTTILNNVKLAMRNGGIYVENGATLVVKGENSEFIEEVPTRTSCAFLMASGRVVIEEGVFNKANSNRYLLYAYGSAQIEIYGGTFYKTNKSAAFQGPGSIIIYGGKFGFDPTAWKAPEATVTKSGSWWYVTSSAVPPEISFE